MIFKSSRTIDKVEVSAPVEESKQSKKHNKTNILFLVFLHRSERRHSRRNDMVGETPHNQAVYQLSIYENLVYTVQLKLAIGCSPQNRVYTFHSKKEIEAQAKISQF
uniref:Uncharacterized protein n=1 Tax=Romanomermis culicivorax TaxID=13658 RepID=A0A915HW23_ROMCU